MLQLINVFILKYTLQKETYTKKIRHESKYHGSSRNFMYHKLNVCLSHANGAT